MLANLISRKLLTEDEIDRDQELITIKKKDGTIVKEISYSSVTINISKTPATEKSRAVLLAVDSVEGMATITNGEELNNFVNSLNEEQKKEIIRKGFIKDINLQEPEANCKTFQEALDWAKKLQRLSEATEDAFWTAILNKGGLDNNLRGALFELCYYNEDTGMMVGCTVTNPVNETSNEYIATENGTYTFTIQDIVTGKTYTKKVEVNNIGITAGSMYKITKESEISSILLQNVDTNIATTFEKAYIRYNNEIIDITKTIQHSETYDHLSSENIGSRLVYLRKIDKRSDIKNTNQLIIIIKDNKVYAEEINMGGWAE